MSHTFNEWYFDLTEEEQEAYDDAQDSCSEGWAKWEEQAEQLKE